MRFTRLLSVLLLPVMLVGVFSPGVSALAGAEDPFVFEVDPAIIDMTQTKKTSEIRIRDPFVLVYGQKYFMYGTCVAKGLGYGCYVSEDLENWAGPTNVFSAPAGYDGTNNFWAPECHFYQGNFYLFATYFSQSTQHRGVSIFKSESPLGPFEEITAGHITPHSWDSIDGTLYMDGTGQPWMVFVHEWTSMDDGIGTMAAAKMSLDLTCFTSEPIQLFKANDPVWTIGGVTDGPFMYKTTDGKLLMLWSNSAIGRGYCVGLAKSSNGDLDGTWSHGFDPLYSKGRYFDLDGGHPMLFTDLNGRLIMCIHSPNGKTEDMHETALFLEVVDNGNTLELKDVQESRDGENKITLFFEDIFTFFQNIFEYFISNIKIIIN